ncbi:hypothetical protein [Streptomyces sp. NPDC006324]|uniref:hypothetical protein n=1 Tax=Streptomyces sp. NPDC006324 TaxID=3156751 RepID=UPI0033B7FEFF
MPFEPLHQGVGHRSAEVDHQQVLGGRPARTGPRLDAAAARWAAVPEGGELLRRWGSDR